GAGRGGGGLGCGHAVDLPAAGRDRAGAGGERPGRRSGRRRAWRRPVPRRRPRPGRPPARPPARAGPRPRGRPAPRAAPPPGAPGAAALRIAGRPDRAPAPAAARGTGWAALVAGALLPVSPVLAAAPLAWALAGPMLAARRAAARHEAAVVDQLPDIVDLL